MEKRMFVIVLLIIIYLSVGCKKKNNDDSSAIMKQKRNMEQKLENVKDDIIEKGHSINDYAYSQKEDYVKIMKNKLNSLKKDLEALQKQTKLTSSNVKAEAIKKFQAVKDSVSKLDEQIESVNSATESNWDIVKTNINESMNVIMVSIEESRKWMSKKIAP